MAAVLRRLQMLFSAKPPVGVTTGGDPKGVQVFRQKQLEFNINVQKVHAELLELHDSKQWY
jgi:hypothetical protein